MTIAAVLHNIRSVHNVGSIFRTADAAGVAKIVCCGITPTPFDRFGAVRADFAKVALGAENSVAWSHEPETAAAIEVLKREGWMVVAIEQSDRAVPFQSLRGAGSEKIALVLGNEVDGLPPDIIGLADVVADIPMRGMKESLNVAVAFGIVAFGIQY